MSVSIIVSMYNKKPSTLAMLDKLFFPSILNQASSDYELILIDDASPLKQETSIIIEKYLPQLRLKFGSVIFSRNPTNLGFAGSYNRGINLAHGDYLVIANDDIYFPQGTIAGLVSIIKNNSQCGIVGPITGESQTWTYQYCKQAPRLKSYTPNELLKIERFAVNVRQALTGKIINTDALAGFCLVTKKSILADVGLFDESFTYGLFEDADLVARIRQKYRVLIAASIYVHHGGIKGSSVSLKQHPLRLNQARFINAYKYGRKWGMYYMLSGVLKGLYRSIGADTITAELKDKTSGQTLPIH